MGLGGMSMNNKMGMNKGGKMGNKRKSGNAFGGGYGGDMMVNMVYQEEWIWVNMFQVQFLLIILIVNIVIEIYEEAYNKHLNGSIRRYEEAQMRNKITKKPQGKAPLKITYGKGQINYSRYNSKGGKKNKLNYYYLF